MYLTKNEIEIMDVLWSAGRPLTRAEIISRSEDKTWKDSSVHILLNSLFRKGAIMEAGFVKCGKTYGRMYAPKYTCEEYHASTLSSTRKKPDIPKLFSALIKTEKLDNETIEQLEALLQSKKTEK
ncbi:MAG: BlaI/MecI/CopY family transcriptional regulator [Oscillospiraceae bacterium]